MAACDDADERRIRDAFPVVVAAAGAACLPIARYYKENYGRLRPVGEAAGARWRRPRHRPGGDDGRRAADAQPGGLVLDRLIHEPARLAILTVLSSVRDADFVFLQRATGLTKGNLSSHLAKLEEAGLVEIEKRFVRKKPNTNVTATAAGRQGRGRQRSLASSGTKRAASMVPTPVTRS